MFLIVAFMQNRSENMLLIFGDFSELSEDQQMEVLTEIAKEKWLELTRKNIYDNLQNQTSKENKKLKE